MLKKAQTLQKTLQTCKQVQTLVFDLDGTLYQDLTFYKTYLHFLLKDTPLTGWEQALVHFTEAVFRGEKLTMNHFYRTKPLLKESPADYFAALELALTEKTEKQEGSIYLGDAWAVVTLLGETLGLLGDGRGELIFRKTREAMPIPQAAPELKNALLKGAETFQTILLSNSYMETGQDFLANLGLEGLFAHVVYDAEKPEKLIRKLTLLVPDLLDRPEAVVAIGDHAWNDLEPLRKLGCCTVWINPYHNIAEPSHDLQLHSTSELADFLEELVRGHNDH